MYASGRNIDWMLGLDVIVGTALIIGSACVLNNVLDVKIDSKMRRTKQRAMVTGEISRKNAFIFASVLGVIGYAILLLFTNLIAFWLGVIALATYVVVYTPLKKRSYIATFVGAVPGAIPPLAAYCSVRDVIDLPALLIFLNMFFWQLPHFFAISIFRKDEYKKADVPVLSIVKGDELTKKVIIIGIVAFMLITPVLYITDHATVSYLLGCLVLSGYWLFRALQFLPKVDSVRWARKMFGVSLMVLSLYSTLLALNTFLP